MKKKTEEYEPALSTNRMAKVLGVDIITIRRMLRRKELAGFKIGPRMWRIPHSELNRLMKAKPKLEISGTSAA